MIPYRRLPRHFTPTDTFHMELTEAEAKTLTFLMPKGCSITQESKSKLKQLPQRTKQQHPPYNQYSSYTQDFPPTTAKQSNQKQPQVPPKPATKPAKKQAPKQQIPQAVKPMLPLLQQLKSYKHSWPFLEAVDAQTLGIPEYYEIVKEPMDLSTVEQKLKSAKYQTPAQFYKDINLMIKNSYIFNASNEEFLKITSDFERYFWRIAGPESKPVNDKKLEREKEKERERLQKEKLKEEKLKEKMLEKERQKERKLLLQQQQQAQLALKQAKKKKKLIPKDLLEAQNISVQQKYQLANNIHSLSKQHLKGIRQIVFSDKHEQSIQQPTKNQNQFDLEKIGYKKIRELQKYVRVKLAEMENAKHEGEMVDKKNQVDLDQMESQWDEEFVD